MVSHGYAAEKEIILHFCSLSCMVNDVHHLGTLSGVQNDRHQLYTAV